MQNSHRLMSWLSESSSRPAPAHSLVTVQQHADACAAWLSHSIGTDEMSHWLTSLSMNERVEFEESILPFCLLVQTDYCTSLYSDIGKVMGERSLAESFPSSLVQEIKDIMDVVIIEDSSSKFRSMLKQLAPPLIIGNLKWMLHPELHCEVFGKPGFDAYRNILQAAYEGFVPEALAIRALKSMGQSYSGSIGQKVIERVAGDITLYSPLACPDLREFLTGSTTPGLDECSRRMSIVTTAAAEGVLSERMDFMVQAAAMNVEYRNNVLMSDLLEGIAAIIDKPRPDVSIEQSCGAIAEACMVLGLSQHEINHVVFKSLKQYTNGKLREMRKLPAEAGLKTLIDLASSRQYDTLIAEVLPTLICKMIKISDPQVVQNAVDNDEKLIGFMYKLTGDQQHLTKIKSGPVLDNCFSKDLGL